MWQWASQAPRGGRYFGTRVFGSGAMQTGASAKALLQPIERLHRRQYLRDARLRLALLADGCDELAILQLDAVHRHRDLGQVDLLVLAVEEIVVARDVGAVVADVAEERALRAIVVERQGERADGARRRSHA